MMLLRALYGVGLIILAYLIGHILGHIGKRLDQKIQPPSKFSQQRKPQ